MWVVEVVLKAQIYLFIQNDKVVRSPSLVRMNSINDTPNVNTRLLQGTQLLIQRVI